MGTPAISQIDFSKVQLNRLLAEIELEQVSNVHIFYNVDKQNGRFRNVFESEEGKYNPDRETLKNFFNNQLDLQDLKITYATVNFYTEIIDVIRDDRQNLLKAFQKVFLRQQISADD